MKREEYMDSKTLRQVKTTRQRSDLSAPEGVLLGVLMGAPIWLVIFLAIYLFLDWMKQ